MFQTRRNFTSLWLLAAASLSTACLGGERDVALAEAELERCPIGTSWDGRRCDVLAPQRISPLTTGVASARETTFEWRLPAGVDVAILELCEDAGCRTIERRVRVERHTSITLVDVPPGPRYWRMRGELGGLATWADQPTWLVHVMPHEVPLPPYLARWRTTFDADRDGYSDVAIGSVVANRLHVYHGSASGLGATPVSSIDDPSGASGARFGESIDGAGDVNGDGYGDLVVSGYKANGEVGEAYVFLGGAGGLSASARVDLPAPPGPASAFGLSVVGIGDVNHDGYSDVAIGAPAASGTHGRVYVYHGGSPMDGTPDLVLQGTNVQHGNFGTSLASGDLNVDGYADLIVGECLATWAAVNSQTSNRVFVFHGGPAGLSGAPAQIIDGVPIAGPKSGFGFEVALAGDRNEDLWPDIAVGAFNVGGFDGAVYVLAGGPSGFGTTPITTFAAPSADGFFGFVVDGAADLDGDFEWDELAIGATDANALEGQVTVSFEDAARFTEDFPGGSGEAFFGHSISAVGDVNGDLHDDLIIGAPHAFGQRGVAYVYDYVPGGGPLGAPTQTIDSPDGPGQRFGFLGR